MILIIWYVCILGIVSIIVVVVCIIECALTPLLRLIWRTITIVINGVITIIITITITSTVCIVVTFSIKNSQPDPVYFSIFNILNLVALFVLFIYKLSLLLHTALVQFSNVQYFLHMLYLILSFVVMLFLSSFLYLCYFWFNINVVVGVVFDNVCFTVNG